MLGNVTETKDSHKTAVLIRLNSVLFRAAAPKRVFGLEKMPSLGDPSLMESDPDIAYGTSMLLSYARTPGVCQKQLCLWKGFLPCAFARLYDSPSGESKRSTFSDAFC